MNLVDTSVWVDHLRKDNAPLVKLLDAGRVLVHPFVIGEVALGQMRQRKVILATLLDLPRAQVATEEEACRRRRARFGARFGYESGSQFIGYSVDVMVSTLGVWDPQGTGTRTGQRQIMLAGG